MAYPAREYDTSEFRSLAPRRNNEEEPEGLFTHRVADRRGDHFDHRGHRNSEPASRAYRGKRSFGSRLDAHDRYRGNQLQQQLPDRPGPGTFEPGNPGWRLPG